MIRMLDIIRKKPIPRPKAWVQEEPDPEEHKNRTQNLTSEPQVYKLTLNKETEPIHCQTAHTQLETETIAPLTENWIARVTNFSTELAQKGNAKKEDTRTPQEMVPTELHEYLDIFDKEKAKRFPESRPWDHEIDLKEDFIPSDCKVYPLTLPETQEMNKFIDKNLEKGYIRPSKSPMASPFFFVDKKDSLENTGLRPCQDYRKLNNGTIKNTYPLPLISELMDKLKGAKYFTKINLRAGYNNVRIRDGTNGKPPSKPVEDSSNPP